MTKSIETLNQHILSENYDKAVELCLDLVSRESKSAIGWHYLGMGLFFLKRYAESLQAYERAIALNPPFSWASKLNLGQVYLLLGELQKGFALYQGRLEKQGLSFRPDNRWQGEGLSGKTLLVHQDEGLGDAIAYLRYLPLLKQLGCEVYLYLRPELRSLFSHLGVPLLSEKKFIYDLHIETASLPFCFKTSLSTIPPPVPIAARRLPIPGRIGIVWQASVGVAKNTGGEGVCAERSISLQLFEPLLQLPGFQYVSLQKDIVKEEDIRLLDRYGVERPSIHTFEDTVALLELCERVISVGTSVAHLAGSMGVPTWVPVQYDPDWFWLLDRDHSPWYPSIRLFRQKRRHDWKQPILEIAQALVGLQPADRLLSVDTWLNLSATEICSGELDKAMHLIQKGLVLHPSTAGLLTNAGIVLERKKNPTLACEYFQRALMMSEQKAEPLFNIAGCLTDLKRYAEALESVEKALQLQPFYPKALQQKAYILMKLAHYGQAAQILQKLSRLDPHNLAVVNDLGIALSYLLRLEEVIDLYRHFLNTHPDQQTDVVKWNLAVPLLLLGRFKEGFCFYEARRNLFSERYYPLPTPRWQGEPIEGKTLLVRGVDGLGDTIQFIRYVPLLRCKIILVLHPSLHPLFQHLGWPIVSPQQTIDHDLHVDMMSFPYLFNTDLSTIPPPIPLQGETRPVKNRIGIVWRGSRATPHDCHRSMNLHLLEPLFQLPDIEFVSLQKDPTEEEKRLLQSQRVSLPRLDTIEDTVRQLQACELVITVDTMVAHLCGSLGIPTWVLLCYVPEWRWMLERSDSPWYPSLRLFRQQTLDDWSEPLKAIQERLVCK